MLRVVLPDRCVHAQPGETCSLFIHHYRDRKTGPQYPVAVVGCRQHPAGCYTLYPPGHVPHGRQAVVPCSASGQLILDARGHPPWSETVFGAAVNASAGVWWPAVSLTDDAPGHRRTQGRHLDQAGHLLGLHPQTDSRTTERVATRLGVPTLVLRTAARDWSPRWRDQGGAVVTVLEALPLDGSLIDRLLAAGMIAELWPIPQRWDAVRRTWVRARSPAPEQVGGQPLGSRASPSTT